MVIGQGLLVASTPFLTRLYTPEDFGLFAVFGAFTSILVTMVALRYEYAIPLEQNERTALALVSATGLLSLAFSLLLCPVVLVWGPSLAQLLGLPALTPLLWLLPPCLLLWGLGSALGFWSVRQGTFRLNGASRIIHHGTQAGGQLGFGLMGTGSAGLVVGYALGYLARFVHLAVALPRAELRQFFRPSLGEIGQVLRRHWRFPAFATSAAALHAASAMLPTVGIAMLYGPAMAGLYGLAQRVVALPLRLVGESASEVFLGEIRNVDHDGLIRLFKRTTALFTGLGLAGLLPLFWLAPWVFAFVFGEAWREAGIIVQLLAPLYLARFVANPISQTLNALDRQDLHLLSSLLGCLTPLLSFAVGWWLMLDAAWTIGLYSVSSSMVFIFMIAIAWWSLKRTDLQSLRRAETSIPADAKSTS